MSKLSRREWLGVCAASGVALLPSVGVAAESPIRFGFSLYGMKTMKLADAIQTCATIGYDCVELALMPGWPTEPKLLSATDRKELRARLVDAKLTLPALMENIMEPAADAVHIANLDKLKAAAELGHDLSPNEPPVIETIIGGKSGDWEKSKERVVERVRAWAEVGKAGKTVIAIKPHVNNALHTPEDTLWLLQQVNSPWLKLAYDHSHFGLQGRKLADTAAALLPEAVFVHIKDWKGVPGKFEFLLPGTAEVDYREYAGLLRKANYKGGVVVEVSGQIFNKPGYDPVAAAKQCYAKVKPAMA